MWASVSGVESAVRGAVQLDQVRMHGRQLGLTETEVEEVVAGWLAWFKTSPLAVEPALIRAALTDRALGREWLP